MSDPRDVTGQPSDIRPRAQAAAPLPSCLYVNTTRVPHAEAAPEPAKIPWLYAARRLREKRPQGPEQSPR